MVDTIGCSTLIGIKEAIGVSCSHLNGSVYA